MVPVERVIRSRGHFLRRRDLLRLGYLDRDIRAALASRRVFRVRHGWYSEPTAPEAAVSAVRVGGRLTGAAALESYGIPAPRLQWVDVAVPRNSCRPRSPTDRRARLQHSDGVRLRWADSPRRGIPPGSWRVPIDDALLLILATESRDIAVACCSAVAKARKWTPRRMDLLFNRAPERVRRWRRLVSWTDDSHGETFVRLWLADAGVPWRSQPQIDGVGRLDGAVSPHVFVEVDGAQHDPHWSGESGSSWEHDHARDATMAIRGCRVLRYTYRQLYGDWPRCLAAIMRARADDLELIARRRRNPSLPRSLSRALSRKRRRYSPQRARAAGSDAP